jgi:hypothetical protein
MCAHVCACVCNRRPGDTLAHHPRVCATVGQLGATSGVAYTAAIVIANYVQVGTGGQAGASAGLLISQPAMLGIYAAVLLLIGVVNTVTVRALGVVGEISGAVTCTVLVACRV